MSLTRVDSLMADGGKVARLRAGVAGGVGLAVIIAISEEGGPAPGS